jgi:hypothetical protein
MKLEAGAGPPIDDPTDEQIAEGLSSVGGERGGFVILSRDTQTYLQASGDPEEGFVLEYRDGDPEEHYRSRNTDVDLRTTTRVFQAYAREKSGWTDDLDWEEVDVERTPEEGVGCLTGLLLLAGGAALSAGWASGWWAGGWML